MGDGEFCGTLVRARSVEAPSQTEEGGGGLTARDKKRIGEGGEVLRGSTVGGNETPTLH